MTYLDVLWLHTDDALPVRILSELDAGRHEIRKLEFFRNGSTGFAEADFAFGGTDLEPAPIPPLDRLNADPRRHGAEISAQEFEALWLRYTWFNS